ncbi:hypothetical protein NDU88_003422 [Pleurodeles waltl]|uniref:Uncharacterized protein n=1 Tax=Pleurodeles waltl TaxID=8319 RepID=A0AAV7VE48_PLEWA|nr:hypothetical protein NDU88_003420 [Pleurodeles waltl]KAJ1199588.1 hypothetical protein NDU88_003422 [Pleurodeles waltl]
MSHVPLLVSPPFLCACSGADHAGTDLQFTRSTGEPQRRRGLLRRSGPQSRFRPRPQFTNSTWGEAGQDALPQRDDTPVYEVANPFPPVDFEFAQGGPLLLQSSA